MNIFVYFGSIFLETYISENTNTSETAAAVDHSDSVMETSTSNSCSSEGMQKKLLWIRCKLYHIINFVYIC